MKETAPIEGSFEIICCFLSSSWRVSMPKHLLPRSRLVTGDPQPERPEIHRCGSAPFVFHEPRCRAACVDDLDSGHRGKELAYAPSTKPVLGLAGCLRRWLRRGLPLSSVGSGECLGVVVGLGSSCLAALSLFPPTLYTARIVAAASESPAGMRSARNSQTRRFYSQ